jgi:hypothetical protein
MNCCRVEILIRTSKKYLVTSTLAAVGVPMNFQDKNSTEKSGGNVIDAIINNNVFGSPILRYKKINDSTTIKVINLLIFPIKFLSLVKRISLMKNKKDKIIKIDKNKENLFYLYISKKIEKILL